MKGMFHLENPVMQFLSKLGDMIIANVLFLLCCLPVVTVGASASALARVTQDLALDQDRGTVRRFFHSFRQNFRQATVVYLALVVIAACLAANWLIAVYFLEGALAVALQGVVVLMGALVLGVAVYLVPLLSRYQNTLGEHVRNAMILAVVKLPRTLALMLVAAAPVLLVLLSPAAVLNLFPVFLLIGFGFLSFLSSELLVPVFFEMEGIDPDRGPIEEDWEEETAQ